MTKEIKKARVEMLKNFDNYIRNIIGDDTITEYWLMEGVPDEANENDLIEITEDDDLWIDCVRAFYGCLE